MKILTIANEKGGVGKTMLSVQFALYASLKFGLKVAVFDLDQQANTSISLGKNDNVHVDKLKAVDLMLNEDVSEYFNGEHGFVLFGADDRLSLLEKQGDEAHAVLLQNFKHNLESLSKYFDLAIIDTNPNPDIRSNLGLIVCTHLVSPILLTKEPIDGITRLIQRISSLSQINENLPGGFIGMIPNAIEAGNFQRQNAKELMEHFGKILIKEKSVAIACKRDENDELIPAIDADGNYILSDKDNFAGIKRHGCIAEAQSLGSPMWEQPNGKEAWSELRKAFFAIIEAMHIERENITSEEERNLLQECKELYGYKSYQKLIRQFFMMENAKVLPKLTPLKINLLREIRKHISLDELLAS